MSEQIHVWDIWVRIGHWTLVTAIGFQWVSGAELGLIDSHATVGILILGWVMFRILWGFAGPKYARFTSFTPTGLGSIKRSLGAFVSGQSEATPGHTVLGGLGILSLLILLALSALTGMASSDDILFDGPLVPLLPSALVETASRLHPRVTDLLYVVIALHTASVLWHQFRIKEPLLQGMWHGKKPSHGASAGAPSPASPMIWLRGFALLMLAVGGCYGLFAVGLGW